MNIRRIALLPLLLAPLAACGTVSSAAPQPAPTATTASGVSTAPTRSTPTGGSVTSSASAGNTTAALTGKQYAMFTAADPAKKTITFDLVEWFEGAKAVEACKQDGETETANDWCVGYYYRNKSHQLRTLPVTSGATLRVVDMTSPEHTATVDLAKLKAGLLKEDRHLFSFNVAGDKITEAREIYLP